MEGTTGIGLQNKQEVDVPLIKHQLAVDIPGKAYRTTFVL